MAKEGEVRLIEMIARVAAATGPDREIDAALMVALRDARKVDDHIYYGPNEEVWYLGEYEGDVSFPPLPYLTSSVDAALSLLERVLPGWCKSVVDLRPEPCEGYVWRRGNGIGNVQGTAATPALALVLAGLIALQREAFPAALDAAS